MTFYFVLLIRYDFFVSHKRSSYNSYGQAEVRSTAIMKSPMDVTRCIQNMCRGQQGQ